MWSLQFPALAPLGGVWAPDFPGFGREPPRAGVATPEALADWVAAEWRSRGWGPAGVAGYSMGGSVATLLALRNPDLVAAVAVCCSSPVWGRGGRRLVAAAFAGLGRRHAMELFQRSVRWGVERHAGDPGHRAEAADMTARAHRPTLLALYRALARLDLRGRLGELAPPLLALGGSRDWLAPPTHQALWLAGAPRAEGEVLPGGDHFLCLGRAREFSAVLSSFFRRHLPPGRAPSVPGGPPCS